MNRKRSTFAGKSNVDVFILFLYARHKERVAVNKRLNVFEWAVVFVTLLTVASDIKQNNLKILKRALLLVFKLTQFFLNYKLLVAFNYPINKTLSYEFR